MKEYLAAQAEQDRLHMEILNEIYVSLCSIRDSHTIATSSSSAAVGSSSIDVSEPSRLDNDETGYDNPSYIGIGSQSESACGIYTNMVFSSSRGTWTQSRLCSTIEESCLIPLLERMLKNESFLDMERHKEIYFVSLLILNLFVEWNWLRNLLGPLEGQEVGPSVCLNVFLYLPMLNYSIIQL